jgi:hypothetical protein
MKPGLGEPVAGPWRVERLDFFARLLADAAGTPSSRPRIIAVDGRGGGGKTTLAGRLCRVMPTAAVVHTDDIAWEHSRFGWDDLMINGVLGPLHAGREVHYQPPAWQPNGRTGHVDVAAGTSTVIVEGWALPAESWPIWLMLRSGSSPISTKLGALGWAVTSSISDSTRPRRCRTGASGRPKRSRSWSTTGHGNELTSSSPALRCWPTIRRPRW